jgi:hypothetical protein
VSLSNYPSVIKNKHVNYRLWTTGGWGNKLRAWKTLPELLASGYTGYIVMRYLGAVGNQWCVYNLPFNAIQTVRARWILDGADGDRIMYNEAAPDTRVILQGELYTGMEAGTWNWMVYSTVKKHMRDALALQSDVSTGLKTQLLLKEMMSPSSFSDFEILTQKYNSHVIEFSVYSCFLGDRPGRNTLVWEVRAY